MYVVRQAARPRLGDGRRPARELETKLILELHLETRYSKIKR